jgi:hypothetical protein
MDDEARDGKPMGRGHLALSRKMFDGNDALWEGDEPFDRRSAWIDLLQLAAINPRRRIVGTAVIVLDRGEALASERFLAARWHWTRGKVERFLALLEKLGRIARKTSHGSSQVPGIVSIVNYDTYNTPRTTSRASDRAAGEPGTSQVRAKEEERKERKEEKKVVGHHETRVDEAQGEGTPVIRLPTPGTADRDTQADEIIRAANAGMAKNPALGPNGYAPIYPGHASRQVVVDWLSDGIPTELCRSEVYRQANEFKPSGRNKQVSSMAYFDAAVRDADERRKATSAEVPEDDGRRDDGRRFVATGTDGAGPRGRSGSDGKVAGAIRPARRGEAGGTRPRIPID